MEIYLAIVWTYLSMSFTMFLILMFTTSNASDRLYKERMEENDKWKDKIEKLIINNK